MNRKISETHLEWRNNSRRMQMLFLIHICYEQLRFLEQSGVMPRPAAHEKCPSCGYMYKNSFDWIKDRLRNELCACVPKN